MNLISEFEFYMWFERLEEAVPVLERHYQVATSPGLRSRLLENNGLLHPTVGNPSEQFVCLTLMKAQPAGVCLGETWGDISSEEAWQKLFNFQRACERTCVAVTGVGLPPENVDDFLKMAARPLKGLF
ncbi:MAG: hypothetical protein ACLFVJ_07860 [Persicimonas sp.]